MRREDFPQLAEGLIYLDSAATTLKPACVIDTLTHFYTHEYATINRSVYTSAQKAGDRYYQTRLHTQKLLGAAHSEEIIFTRGTTHSLNLLASSLGAAFLGPSNCVILSEIEHHSNLVPWQMMAQRVGCTLLFVRVDDKGMIDLAHLAELLVQHEVKIISVAHVSNVTGSVQPIEKMIPMAHAAGALVALDGAQAVSHLAVDVQALAVDFYAFSSHKMYGPTGVGVLYGKRALLEQIPPYEGGGDMIKRVALETSSYADLPHKFEAGTPAIAEVIGFGRAISYINKIGYEQIDQHITNIRDYAYEKLRSLDVEFVGCSDSALLSFTIKEMHPLDVATLLDCKQIALRSGHLCSEPAMRRFGVGQILRISFGVYTTKEDIDVFISSLSALKRPLYNILR